MSELEEYTSVKLTVNEVSILNLLATLSTDELYGLEILNRLTEARNKIEHVKTIQKMDYKTLYPILKRLVNKNLISWRWGDETEKTGGARRKYYQISKLGKQVLRERQNFNEAIENMYGAISI